MKKTEGETIKVSERVLLRVGLCLLLAALIFLCMTAQTFEKKNGWRVDCSFNAVTTQSEQTVEILKELDQDVHIYALFTKGQEDAPLMELLDRYAAVCDRVTWEKADVNLNPGLVTRFSGNSSENTLTNDSIIVSCEATDRYRILSPADFVSLSLDYEAGVYEIAGLTYESSLTSAIRYVSRDRVPKVWFLTGHGELGTADAAAYCELLENNQYEARALNLLSGQEHPAQEDLVAILCPQRDLMDSELDTLVNYADQGGSFLFVCDYQDDLEKMENFRTLMRSYGFVPRNGIVLASADEPGTYYENYRIDLLPEMCSTDITTDLIAEGADTLLLTGSRAFETPTETDRNLTVMEVLRSGREACLKDLSAGMVTLEYQEGDPKGPFSLALEARRVTTGGYVSRAFVMGCSTMLTSEQLMTMTDDQEFLIRVTEFLSSGERSDLGILAKTALRPQLSVRSVSSGAAVLVALPVLVLVAGFAILLPRKRRM